MKWINQSLIVLFLLAALLGFTTPQTVSAQSEDDGNNGQVVIGGIYSLESGETLDGDLVLIGGSATLEADSVVTGSVLIAGGTIESYGTIEGDVLTFGGIFTLHDTANLNGDLVSYGGVNNLDDSATIEGNIVNNDGDFANFNWESLDLQFEGFTLEDLNFDDFNLEDTTPNSQAFATPHLDVLKQVSSFFWGIAKAFGLAILAVVASLFVAKPMKRTCKTLFTHPALSFGVGLLTLIVLPALLVILMITIILIPVSLIGLIGVGLAILFGWFALSLMLGERIAQLFHAQWSAPLSTGIGSLVLSLVSAITGVVPCIGWLFPLFFASAGLGAVLLSRFGSRIYIDQKNIPPAPKTPQSEGQPKAAEYTLPVVGSASESESLNIDLLPPLDIDHIEEDEPGISEEK